MLDWVYAQGSVDKIYLPTNGIEFYKAGGSRTLGRRQEKVLVLLQFDSALAQTNQLLRRANPARQRVKLIKN